MNYELIYILLPKFTDAETEKKASEINKLVQDRAERIIRKDFWGKKKLAYRIENFFHGFYVLVEFSANPEKIKDLDKELRKKEEILRFLITRIDEKIEMARKMAARKEAEKVVKKIERTAEKKKEEEKVVEEIKEKGKARLKDLDKKIEEILDEDIT